MRHRFDLLQQALAAFALLLIAATWPLWWATGDFPLAPLAFGGWLRTTPRWVDHCLSTLLVVALLGVIAAVHRPGKLKPHHLWMAVVFCTASLVCLNQHRLQAWTWQLLLCAMLFANCPPPTAWRWMRWLVASIYIHSALGKFDHSFLHTLGEQFGEVIFRGLPVAAPRNMSLFALAFPVGELAAGLLLLAPRCQRAGVAIAVAMHLALLVILGPLGLDHHLGVLLWNAFFLAATPLLFLPSKAHSEWVMDAQPSRTSPIIHLWTCGVLLAAFTLPFAERAGAWDHWPSWGLYSPANPRALMWVTSEQADELPEALRAHLVASGDGVWQRLSLASLSLRCTRSPIYPQDRFHLAVGLEIARRHRLQRHCRFAIQGFPNRWTGKRPTEYANFAQATRRAHGYRLNAVARTE